MTTYQASKRRQDKRDTKRAVREILPALFAITYVGLCAFAFIASFPGLK